jgi:hypothetical protein
MRIGWTINRLRAMSPPEIAHRLREQATRRRWRSRAAGWDTFARGDGALPAVPELGTRLDGAAGADPRLAARIASEYARIDRGDLVLLGRQWAPGTLAGLAVDDPQVFLRDPVSGRSWPGADRYCFDVPYRHLRGFGDIKFLWELNRLQVLQVAAAHARLTSDAGLETRVLGVVRAWMDANPPFRGPNWCSGIELAVRIATLVVVLSLRRSPPGADDRSRLRAFLDAHALWLSLYPSRFSSANNHAIAEGLGLFLAGLLVPDLPNASAHEREGRALLEREGRLQLGEDGVGVEQSPTYTAFSMEMIAFACAVAAIRGQPLAPALGERLRRSAEHIGWIANADGRTPAIGDNDEGRILATSLDSESRYACSVAACAAGLSGATGTLALPVGHPPEMREALIAGPSRETAGAAAPPTGMRTFPDGGYTVVRETIVGRPSILTFDHGPLGYLSIAAHGHADALAIWLDVDGAPVLTDAGTWMYHAGGRIRDQLRSTGVHNTMLVEGASQSRPAGAFNWSQKAAARLLGSGRAPSWWVEGEHDGYRGRFGVMHVRRLAGGAPGEIVVSDRLEGKGAPRKVSIRFLPAPDVVITDTATGFALARADGLGLTVDGPADFRPRRIPAIPESATGWVSSRFGHRAPSTMLAFDGQLGAAPAVTHLRLSFADAAGGG